MSKDLSARTVARASRSVRCCSECRAGGRIPLIHCGEPARRSVIGAARRPPSCRAPNQTPSCPSRRRSMKLIAGTCAGTQTAHALTWQRCARGLGIPREAFVEDPGRRSQPANPGGAEDAAEATFKLPRRRPPVAGTKMVSVIQTSGPGRHTSRGCAGASGRTQLSVPPGLGPHARQTDHATARSHPFQ
jgi:hypothetical protein